jgi:glycosyltransferase involved in cell wall biosynthesis
MSNKIDFFTRKIAYLYLFFSEKLVNSIVFIYVLVYKKKVTKSNFNKIATYWYCPPDLTGSNLRLGGWKTFFETDGIQYDNFHINLLKDIVSNIEKGNWTKKYLFFASCLWRRLPQMLKAHHYDVIWIDRGIIPLYPRKSAFLEKQLKKVVYKLVVDTTDGGDYSANPQLMEDTLKQADEITVGYKYLKEFYDDRFKTTQIFWTIPTENYQIKDDYEIKGIPIIGWMGSPANFEYIIQLLPQLLQLKEKHDFIFRYVCRENFNHILKGLTCEHHYYDENYYKIIASFDIGISPFLVDNLRTKGKIAMKHQEFLLMGIPQVCSPMAISEFVVHGEHVLIASQVENWHENLLNLIKNIQLREKIGIQSKEVFQEYYTFNSQYIKLRKILTTN